MKLRLITLVTIIAAMLVMPSLASAACNVGVTNGVAVAPPTPVWTGQTQTQNYMVTACTAAEKVTVEWVKVTNSDLPFMLNAGNRTSISGETSVGREMVGTSSWTVPAGAAPGHYGVITRYYAQGSTAPEALAASSFQVAVDKCPNIAGGQSEVPNGMIVEADGTCKEVICRVLYTTNGTPVYNNTDCIPPDKCPNIDGNQPAVPVGLIVQNGLCVEVATPQGNVGTPKLGITKVGNRKAVRQGGTVKFTIKVRNTGDADSGRIRVCDIFPAGLTYITNTNGGAFTQGKLCWTLANVAKGKTVTVGVVTAKVTKNRGRVVNTACIMAHPVTGTARKLCAKAPVTVTPRPEPSGGVTG